MCSACIPYYNSGKFSRFSRVSTAREILASSGTISMSENETACACTTSRGAAQPASASLCSTVDDDSWFLLPRSSLLSPKGPVQQRTLCVHVAYTMNMYTYVYVHARTRAKPVSQSR